MHPSALGSGHISVGTVGSAGAGATRTTPIISLTVTGTHPKNVAAVTNYLANAVVERTTANYVKDKIETISTTLANVKTQIASLNDQSQAYTAALKEAQRKNLDPLQQLVIIGQQNNAATRLGNLIAQEETLQQQLVFAQQVEAAQIVEKAAAEKTSAHSRSSSILIGALIGLIIGAIVAIAGEGRFRRTQPA
jgi:capsular polysaccharide biosynthesis protein